MKTNKILKVMSTVIIIILLVFISFIGIYMSKNGRMVDVLKEYNLGMELGGGRQIVLSPVSDTKTVYEREDGKTLINTTGIEEEQLKNYKEKEVEVNSKELLTAENYKNAKDVFKKRIDATGLTEYQIGLEESTGNIIIKALEDNVLDKVIYTLFAKGELILQDSETLETLLTNNQIKEAKVGYSNNTTGTGIYLTIELNKEGTKKLEEISKVYVKSTDAEGKEVSKTVTLYIDGQTITTTYFGEVMTEGILQLSIGKATNTSEELNSYVTEATNIATMLSAGSTNVEYQITENQYLTSGVNDKLVLILLYAAVIAITALITYIVIEYKERGIVAGIAFIGYIAALLLVVRLTNVVITLESIGAIILAILFTYIFINILLNRLSNYKKNDSTPKAETNKTIITSLFTLVPALVISVVFCFITYMSINSFGTALFWGIIMFVIYAFAIIKPLLLNFEYLFEEK